MPKLEVGHELNALYWAVSAEKAGPAVIRISYLIGNMAAGVTLELRPAEDPP